MGEAAIQEDVVVPEKEGKTQIEKAEEPEVSFDEKRSRDEIIDTINKRRREEIEEDLEGTEFETIEEEEVEIELEDKPEPKPEPEKVEVKINGETSLVTPEEIREYQINKAADKRMKEAADKEAELSRKEAELAEKQKIIEANERTKIAAEKAKASEKDYKKLAQEFIDGVFSEDTDKTAKALEELDKRRDVTTIPKVQPTKVVVDPAVVQSAVSAELIERDRLKAVERYKKEYPKFASDDLLSDKVNSRTIVEMKEDPDASWWEVIDRAAKHVKGELYELMGVEEKDLDKKMVQDDLKERQEKKKKIGNSIKSASIKSDLKPKPTKPKLSPVQQIMKSRGQL